MSDSFREYAWGISSGSMNWSTFGFSLDPNEVPIVRHRTDKHTPAAVLLNRDLGEPLRLDHWLPSHPRGSGNSWPPESRVEPKLGAGRFPLAAAWTGRRNNLAWRWTFDGDEFELGSLDAIAAGVSELTRIYAKAAPATIVVPNDFRQREQQKVLDTCQSKGLNAALLWSPIAAALAWIDAFRHELPSPLASDAERLVLPVVHADWGVIRCSIIHLVRWEKEERVQWVPARRRPAISDTEIDGFGWKEVASCEPHRVQCVWRDVFAHSPTTARSQSSHDHTTNLLEMLAGWSVDQTTSSSAGDHIATQLRQNDKPVGVVVIGDFADRIAEGPGFASFLRSLQDTQSKLGVLIANGLAGEDLLAKGAAIFTKDRLQGRTSYLDTLPNLELFVDRAHQYEWLRLLGESDQVVQGGQEWELPDPIEGLAIRRGASSINLVVAHDEYEGVRELRATLEHPAEQRLAARLHVSATPAQGNAKLRLITDAYGNIPTRSILANWDRMKPVLDTKRSPVDKETFLRMQPRAYPELFPRRWSRAKWRVALPTVNKLNRQIISEDAESTMKNPWLLTQLKNRLSHKDQSQTPFDATAIGSDFKAPCDQDALIALAASLLSLWQKYRGRPNSHVSTVVRALGYISVDNAEFEKWLVENLNSHINDPQSVLHAAGLSIRAPENVAKLVTHVFMPNGQVISPGANELKAISQVLRYRADATRYIENHGAETIISECLRIFKRGMEAGGRGYSFRWSSLIVVYLLRRRMFDHDFLNPEEPLAIDAKQLFRIAIKRHKQGTLYPIGGSVDVPAALQQMIDYIDRKGSGDILMASE